MASEARATAMELVRAWGAGDLKNNLFLKEHGGGDVAAVDRVRHDGLCAVEEPSSVHQPMPTTCNPFPPPSPVLSMPAQSCCFHRVAKSCCRRWKRASPSLCLETPWYD